MEQARQRLEAHTLTSMDESTERYRVSSSWHSRNPRKRNSIILKLLLYISMLFVFVWFFSPKHRLGYMGHGFGRIINCDRILLAIKDEINLLTSLTCKMWACMSERIDEGEMNSQREIVVLKEETLFFALFMPFLSIVYSFKSYILFTCYWHTLLNYLHKFCQIEVLMLF